MQADNRASIMGYSDRLVEVGRCGGGCWSTGTINGCTGRDTKKTRADKNSLGAPGVVAFQSERISPYNPCQEPACNDLVPSHPL